MVSLGYFLSSEEHTAQDLVTGAALAEQAGFDTAWISDHYHPWNDEQGQSPFVWSVLGAIAAATSTLRLTTAVTCPTVRIHPAVLAQAAATTGQLFDGRFRLGVGSGEALNECITGAAWPSVDVRLQMLEEAVEVMRALWTGEVVHHHGRHYTVDHARLYTLPDEPVPVLVSGFGPKSTRLAARIGDGYVNVTPDAELPGLYRAEGGKGPIQGGLKACWGPDEGQARALAHRLWPNEALPGEAAQVLPTPEHFQQLSPLITEDMVAGQVACGPDPERHLAAIQRYIDAGYDEIYVAQIGPDQRGFLDFYAKEIVPHLP